MSNWWHHKALRSVALVLLCLALYLPGQASVPPFDRDESRFMQATKQMVESGDYIDIRFQDEARHKKPVGIYWLQSASVKLTGVVDQAWAYRIPSWLSATLVVVITSLIGARFFGPLAGLLAGAMLASCLLMGVEARMAKTDATLLATIVMAQYVLARLWQDKALSRGMAVVFWLAVGAGILIKGPLILLAVGATAIVLSVIQRNAGWLKPLQPLWGVPLMLVVVAPWLIAITLKTGGAFWQESVGQDLMSKAVSVQESHGGVPGYYLGTFFITFWPWAFLLVPAVIYAWQQRRNVLVQFLLAWIIPFWLLFEFFPTKLLHYTLPTFPAIALLFAGMLLDAGYTIANKLKLVALALGSFMLATVALAIPFAPSFAFPMPVDLSFLSIAAGLLLVAGAVVAFGMRARKPVVAISISTAVLVNFYAAFWGQQFPGMSQFWVSRSVAQVIAPYRAACPGPVVAIGYAEPSLVFYLGTDTVLTSTVPAPTSACRLLLIEQRQLQNIDPATALQVIRGFNYSKGHEVALYLLQQNPANVETPQQEP